MFVLGVMNDVKPLGFWIWDTPPRLLLCYGTEGGGFIIILVLLLFDWRPTRTMFERLSPDLRLS